jgi:hypothetical protein
MDLNELYVLIMYVAQEAPNLNGPFFIRLDMTLRQLAEYSRIL